MDCLNIVKTLTKRENANLRRTNRDILKVLEKKTAETSTENKVCLLYTSPSPRDATLSRMPSSA